MFYFIFFSRLLQLAIQISLRFRLSKIINLTMKARSNRTHFMGTSNRSQKIDKNKSISILQRSFNKSLMLNEKHRSTFLQTANKSEHFRQVTQNQDSKKAQYLRKNPFLGINNQLQSKRFDKMNMKRPYKKQQQIKMLPKLIDLSCHLNQKVKQIKNEFKDSDISMHKLYLIKQTFLKNNRDRSNLKEQFFKYAGNQQRIDKDKLKKLINRYGYDINDDQIRLMFALNRTQLKSQSQNKQELQLSEFVTLMTKDNIYYKTLSIQHQQKNTRLFIDRHFQILRNKFAKLKEAFKIYRQRQQQINYQNFTYTMKKLDITDLIMPKKERDQLFKAYSNQNGQFNAQKLLSAIAIQNHSAIKNRSQKNQFQQNLKYLQQQQHQKQGNKIKKFDLKRSSYVQYQRHMSNAIQVLQKIRQCHKQGQIIEQLYNGKQNVISIRQLNNKLQNILQKQGFNFSKDHYDSLISYFDFDRDDNINKPQLQNFMIKQTKKQAMNRFQRRVRTIRPSNQSRYQFFDQKQALKSLRFFKQAKMNPQNSKIFDILDLDHDGYISKDQFSSQLQKIQTTNNQINTQNLINYFFQGSYSLNRKQFQNKFNNQSVVIQPFRSKSVSQWTHLKRSVISENNNFKYQNPTKFSAWPSHLNELNLSLIQPPKNAGIFLSELDRFNTLQKHNFGQRQKLQRAKIYNKKIQKISIWNNRYKQQLKERLQVQQKKMQEKNYHVRVTREKYLQNIKEEH